MRSGATSGAPECDEGSQGGGKTAVAAPFEPCAGGDDELLTSGNDDAGCAAQPVDEPLVLMVGNSGKAAGSKVDTGSQAEVGTVHVVVGPVVEEMLLVVDIEGLAQLGAGAVVVEPDHPENEVRSFPGLVELLA